VPVRTTEQGGGALTETTVNPVYRPKTAARYAGCHEKTVLRALRQGELVGYQRGPNCSWRIYQSDLDAYIRDEAPARKRSA
jgi:excisionase family DNA binding protein